MFILSAFADEISPDPREQIAVLKACNVRHIEFRSIHKTNVLALSDEQVREFKKLLDGEGFKLSAIGSPIGKVAVDADFNAHLDKFKRQWTEEGDAVAKAIRTSFPLTHPAPVASDGAPEGLTGSQTGPGPRGSGSPADPEGCPPAAAADA